VTTLDDLRTEREQRDRARRLADRQHARAVLTGALIGKAGPIPEDRPGHWVFPGELCAAVCSVLDMVGLIGDPEDGYSIPVVLPHAFHQPAAKLSAPVGRGYR
jgi:hypothetical protein